MKVRIERNPKYSKTAARSKANSIMQRAPKIEGSNDQAKIREYYRAKDEAFAVLKAGNAFQDTFHCRYGHHVGDCCLTCGNDERRMP